MIFYLFTFLFFPIKQRLRDMSPKELDQRSVETCVDYRADPNDHEKIPM